MTPCSIAGCDRKARSRFLCSRHYEAALKGRIPLPPLMNPWIGKDPLERFMARVEKAEDGCWIWTGAISVGTGYASFRADGASSGHRWAYQHFIGPIPDGLVIDHLCRVRRCVNPEHLEAVPMAENTRRGDLVKAIRRRAASLTHCPHGHEKNDANTYRSYNGKRRRWEVVCRPCRNARLARRRAEKRGV